MPTRFYCIASFKVIPHWQQTTKALCPIWRYASENLLLLAIAQSQHKLLVGVNINCKGILRDKYIEEKKTYAV